MYLVGKEDNVKRAHFDNIINSDNYSFIQQTSIWTEIVTISPEDTPVLIMEEDANYTITSTLYLFASEVGKFLIANIHAGSIGCFTYLGCEDHKEYAYKKLLNEIIEFAKNNKCIAITITSNPYTKDFGVLKNVFPYDAGMETFISFIDIEKYFDENGNVEYVNYNRRSNLSRNIKKGYMEGFEFEGTLDGKIIMEWYEKIHCRRIKELLGTPLPKKLFENIINNQNFSNNYIFFSIKKNGELLGGDLCIYSKNGNLDNFMISTDSDYLNKGINYFLVDKVLKWCLNNDIKMYNWQSSNPPNGGIFNFKKNWGSKVLKYYYLSHIIDKEEFEYIRQNYSFDKLMKYFSGYFVAPFQTIKNGDMSLLDKSTINNIASIYIDNIK